MVALAANLGSTFKTQFGHIYQLPVKAAVHIYRFAMVTIRLGEGYAQPAADDTDDSTKQLFVGYAMEEIDNSDGGNGDLNVRVRMEGRFWAKKTAATQADVGKLAVVLDDQTVQLYQVAGRSNVVVGRIVKVYDTSSVMIHMMDRPSRVSSGAND